ncbi:MAG: hypothetical protein JRI23_09795 [Deltaproteobacteria bacterium]|jgi:hypothetical protein|nr:hypothetical protein [Deltaproteobacteria bacterium]MBW2531960.1 hypothetical protein [Deltaproteobacteria bacterium]
MRRIVATVVSLCLLVLPLTGCGADEEQQTPTSASGEGGGGGGVPVEPPDAGLLPWICPPGEREIEDGTCQAAGIPPEACGEWLEPVGGGCRAILPTEPCPSGLMAVPGYTECHEPAPCGAGPWGDIPADANTQYVDGSYGAGDSDGTSGKPWTSVQQGVDAATAGAVVAIAAGVYDETVLVQDKAVRLWGVCPAQTALVDSGGGAPVVRFTNAHGSELHDLAVSGPQVGVQLHQSTDVVIEGLWIHDLGNLGLDAERAGGAVSFTLRDTLVERASWHAVFLYGAEATFERVEVRQTQLNAGGERGRGIAIARDADAGVSSEVTLRRVLSHDQYWHGIGVFDSDALIEDSVVLDIETEPGRDRGGEALLSQGWSEAGSQVVVRRVELGRAADCGLTIEGDSGEPTSLEAEALSVHDIDPAPGLADTGSGVCAFDDTGRASVTLSLRDGTIERTVTTGVLVSGAPATLEGVLVRDVALAAEPRLARALAVQTSPESLQPNTVTIRGARVQAPPELGVAVLGATVDIQGVAVVDDPATDPPPNPPPFGAGILVQETLEGVPASAAITDSLVDGAPSLGLLVLGADATIENTHVRAPHPSPLGSTLARGILVQASFQTQTRSAATIERCLVEESPEMAIAVIGASVDIAHTVVRNSLGVNGFWGDGLVLASYIAQRPGHDFEIIQPAEVQIRSTLVQNVARAGLFAAAGTVHLSDSMMLCAPIALNGEQVEGFDFDLVDEGGNHCGCDGVFPPCRVLSEGLSAPDPVDPEG